MPQNSDSRCRCGREVGKYQVGTSLSVDGQVCMWVNYVDGTCGQQNMGVVILELRPCEVVSGRIRALRPIVVSSINSPFAVGHTDSAMHRFVLISKC